MAVAHTATLASLPIMIVSALVGLISKDSTLLVPLLKLKKTL